MIEGTRTLNIKKLFIASALAKVVAADVAADNGVIHAIDTVLMPK